MALNIGARLGPYEVQAVVGAGGMGEVYKARDTRLNRTVAIKILPPQWAADPVMQQRFDREAKVIAGLNHPHICTLHDIGHEEAIDSAPALDFLVMEFLEGETLADRLEKGALPLREALTIAVSIADALDKAHRQGVVHRDLKPANVMLTKRGAKLLDFGLAKPGGGLQPAMPAAGEGRSMLPTAAGVTTPGTIVGTVQYMAPEQLEGRDADTRTDIFAFGVVLYEMVTGRKAFQGKSKTLLMSAILTSEPKPLAHAQPMSPAALDHLVRRCLAKDPEERWQTAHDLLVQLRWIAGIGTRTSASDRVAVSRRERILRRLGAAALVIAGGLAFPATLYLWPAEEPEEFQFRSPVIGLSPPDISVSPDGQTIAFVARPNTNEPRMLFLRPVRGIASRRIAQTDDAEMPFWSPDSKSIGFVANGTLKRVEAAGGPPRPVTPASDVAGGTWNSDGVILFGSSKGVFRVSAEGGTPEAVTKMQEKETGHSWPAFLPDGRRFLYLAWSTDAGGRAVFAGSLDSMNRTNVMAVESNAIYAASGHLVYHREATVFAQPFDVDALKPSGDAFQLADGVAHNPATGRGYFETSQTGALIYFQGAGGPAGRAQTVANIMLGWIRSDGTVEEAAGDAGQYGDFDLSPDGRLIAVTRQDAGSPGADIWVIDWQRGGVPTPLTRDPNDDLNPVWASDSRRVAFTSFRKGNADIYVRDATGTDPETPLLQTEANEFVEGWSSDGRYLLYLTGRDNAQDIYALPLSADGKPAAEPLPVVVGQFQKNEPQLSHDMKWLAYTSDESGRFEVWITDFPSGKFRQKITKDGAGQPRWGPKDRQLYYRRSEDNTLMVVDVPRSGSGIAPSVPMIVFRPTVNTQMSRDPTRHQLAISPDGERFLVRVPPVLGGGRRGITLMVGGRGIASAQLFATGAGREAGRGGGPANANVNALTVLLNWTAKGR